MGKTEDLHRIAENSAILTIKDLNAEKVAIGDPVKIEGNPRRKLTWPERYLLILAVCPLGTEDMCVKSTILKTGLLLQTSAVMCNSEN